MKMFSRDDLRTLTEKRQGPCLSIYMPTHRIPTETQQDRTRLKNLLRQAEETLLTAGLRAREAKAFLEPGEKLIRETLFWKDQRDGLALFMAPGFFRSYLLPLNFDELVVVTERFHVKPLLGLLTGHEFFILALSQNAVRLLEGSRFGVSEINDLEGVPPNLAEALKYDELEKQLQFHTGTTGGRGDRAAMFHGHGVGSDDTKDRILRYFHQIDDGLHQLLREEKAPLVLAGVEYLLPIYREVNTYPYLLDGKITGNPEGLRPEELHAQAWAIVRPHFQKAQHDAAAQYRQLAGTAKASTDIKEIAPAAYHGRVECLFVAVGRQQWGAFDPATNRVRLHPQKQPGDEDVLDFVAIQTLLNGGTVFAVAPGEVPDDAPLAAVFRY